MQALPIEGIAQRKTFEEFAQAVSVQNRKGSDGMVPANDGERSRGVGCLLVFLKYTIHFSKPHYSLPHSSLLPPEPVKTTFKLEILDPAPLTALRVVGRLSFSPQPPQQFLRSQELAAGGSRSRLDNETMGAVGGPFVWRAAGFTLVEVLVVIAIVAVLAILGIGTVNSAIERSRQSECANNLRRLASGVFAYAADNNGAVTPANRFVGGRNIPWPDMLQPYVEGPTNGFKGRKSVYFCPCGRHPRGWNNTLPDYTCNARGGTGQKLTGGFSMDSPNNTIPPTRMTEIQRPSKMMMFADGFSGSDINQGNFNVTANFATQTYFGKPELPVSGLAPRHSHKSNPVEGSFNVVFFDGHLESFEWSDPRLQDPAFLLDLVRRY